MNRVRLATIIFGIMLLVVFFNYIYVYSVRTHMLAQIDELREHAASQMQPNDAEKSWKSRKRLLLLSVPRAALDQIDIQFSELHACAQAKDHSAYLRTCYRLHELISALGS